MSTFGPPQCDAPRGTWSVRLPCGTNPPPVSLTETSITYRTNAEQVSIPPNFSRRAAKTYPPNPLMKGIQSGMAAPAKLTIPDIIPEAEMSRSSTYHSVITPDSKTSRHTMKEKFIKGVLSTQLGQAVSDNLAPQIPRAAVAGFPEDDDFHSRNSYISATMNLWDQMRRSAIVVSSDLCVELAPTSQPDNMPRWVRDEVLNMDIFSDNTNKHNQTRPASVPQTHPSILCPGPKMSADTPQPHPTILRSGPKKLAQQDCHSPLVPPGDKIDYRIPIHQSFKAQTYPGRQDPEILTEARTFQYQAQQVQQDALKSSNIQASHGQQVPQIVPPVDHEVSYRKPIYQTVKAETYHGNQAHKPRIDTSKTIPGLPDSPSTGPDKQWLMDSSGSAQYWSESKMLIRAAPIVDRTNSFGRSAGQSSLSTSSHKRHRSQHVFGSYSTDSADKLEASSSSGVEQAKTYPPLAPSRRQAPLLDLQSLRPRQGPARITATRTPQLRSTIKYDKPGSSSIASQRIFPLRSSQIPVRSPTKQTSSLREPAPHTLMGVEPLPDKTSHIRPTAEQRQLAADIFNKKVTSSQVPDIQPRAVPKYPSQHQQIRRKPLSPQAKTFVYGNKPVEHSWVANKLKATVATERLSSMITDP